MGVLNWLTLYKHRPTWMCAMTHLPLKLSVERAPPHSHIIISNALPRCSLWQRSHTHTSHITPSQSCNE